MNENKELLDLVLKLHEFEPDTPLGSIQEEINDLINHVETANKSLDKKLVELLSEVELIVNLVKNDEMVFHKGELVEHPQAMSAVAIKCLEIAAILDGTEDL